MSLYANTSLTMAQAAWINAARLLGVENCPTLRYSLCRQIDASRRAMTEPEAVVAVDKFLVLAGKPL